MRGDNQGETRILIVALYFHFAGDSTTGRFLNPSETFRLPKPRSSITPT